MAVYSTSEFRGGLKVMIDNAPCEIIENEFVKPGKGQAFNRVKYRNYLTGRVLEKTFRSGESVPGADIVEIEMQYVYADDEFMHFMDPVSFEQQAVTLDVVSDSKKWLKEQDSCTVLLYDGNPLSVAVPNFVNLTVSETDPGVRGDTVTGGSKPATLESGATIKVPLFVEIGDILRVDTRKGEYVSRVKE